MRVVSLFSGIGGLELGFHSKGYNPLLFCEIDPIAQTILKNRFENADHHSDIKELKSIPECEVITAGFPCQDLSQAGGKVGIGGHRSGLVKHLFSLLSKLRKKNRPEWLVIENVPYMLRLDQGKAMSVLTSQITSLGYRWAYRVVDARSFGIPQRRHRVLLVASKNEDPRGVLFADNYDEPELDGKPSEIDETAVYGFYWTEGSRGVGWAKEGIPPIKCGSTLGIASPPAVWIPSKDFVGTIAIEDAERLQGFPEGWTNFRDYGVTAKPSFRWRLVGNAVSTAISTWVSERLVTPGQPQVDYRPLPNGSPWPNAAYGDSTGQWQVMSTRWASSNSQQKISDFLNMPLSPLSARATQGFLKRARGCTNVVYSPRFLDSLEKHSETMSG